MMMKNLLWRLQALVEYMGTMGEVSEARPWMLQQLLQGCEFSSYSVAHEGQLVMHSDNEACLSCLDYAHINSQQVPPGCLLCHFYTACIPGLSQRMPYQH